MLKVVVLARHYFPSPGAATSRLTNMVKALRDGGHDVTVITRTLPGSPATDRELGPMGERIVRVSGDTSTGFGLKRAWELLGFAARAMLAVRRLVPAADVMVSDPPPTVGIGLIFLRNRSSRRSIYYLSDSWRDLVAISGSGKARHLAFLVGIIENFVVRRVDIVIAATTHLAQYARRLNSNVVCLRNGVDGIIFTADGPSSSELAPKGDLPYFLYAGNYGEAHGASVFALAAERLWRNGEVGFGLVYVGYGSDAPDIHKVAQAWPGQLRIIDPVQPPVVAAAFRGALAGLASVKDVREMHGATPVKALASIMSGCPLIYAGGGSFRSEVVDRGWGAACDTDVEQVAQSMLSFLRSPWTAAQRARLGAEAQDHYDNRVHQATYRSIVELATRT